MKKKMKIKIKPIIQNGKRKSKHNPRKGNTLIPVETSKELAVIVSNIPRSFDRHY